MSKTTSTPMTQKVENLCTTPFWTVIVQFISQFVDTPVKNGIAHHVHVIFDAVADYFLLGRVQALNFITLARKFLINISLTLQKNRHQQQIMKSRSRQNCSWQNICSDGIVSIIWIFFKHERTCITIVIHPSILLNIKLFKMHPFYLVILVSVPLEFCFAINFRFSSANFAFFIKMSNEKKSRKFHRKIEIKYSIFIFN